MQQFNFYTMTTYRELIYMVLDQLKLSSDDSYYTEDHALFLLKKCRGLLLEQKYKDLKKEIPSSNYQTVCLDLEESPAIEGAPCEGGIFLKSTVKLPELLGISKTNAYTESFYSSINIAFVSKERMQYVGNNRWLQNIIYCSKGDSGYLYLKSSNPQFLQLEKIRVNGIFEDPEEADKLDCCKCEDNCELLDKQFPIEESLVSTLIQTVVQFLSSGIYKPEDTQNNASDDLATIASFIRNNMKSNLQKQIDG